MRDTKGLFATTFLMSIGVAAAGALAMSDAETHQEGYKEAVIQAGTTSTDRFCSTEENPPEARSEYFNALANDDFFSLYDHADRLRREGTMLLEKADQMGIALYKWAEDQPDWDGTRLLAALYNENPTEPAVLAYSDAEDALAVLTSIRGMKIVNLYVGGDLALEEGVLALVSTAKHNGGRDLHFVQLPPGEITASMTSGETIFSVPSRPEVGQGCEAVVGRTITKRAPAPNGPS